MARRGPPATASQLPKNPKLFEIHVASLLPLWFFDRFVRSIAHTFEAIDSLTSSVFFLLCFGLGLGDGVDTGAVSVSYFIWRHGIVKFDPVALAWSAAHGSSYRTIAGLGHIRT